MQKTSMTKVSLLMAVSFSLMMTGCQWFGVYHIDTPQGTPLVQSVANKVTVGMTANQVLYILGSPALRDTLSPNRWDYIYHYQAGTDGRRLGKKDITHASQYLSVYFDDTGRVIRIDGIDTLPPK